MSLYKSVILGNWVTLAVCVAIFLLFWKLFNSSSRNRRLNQGTLQNADDEYPESVQEYPESDPDLSPSLTVENYVNYPGAQQTLPEGIDRLFEILNDRRSIRHFSSRPVDISVVEKCIHAAGTSPSGAHSEPWTFCLITNEEIKQQVRTIVETEELINYQQRMARQWTTDLRPFKTNHIKEYLTVAPCLILVFKQTYGVRADGKRKEHYYNEISTSIATGILLCALQAAGLSSLVTTPLNCGPALRTILDRPQNEKLLVLLPVGYPADECPVPDLQRKPLNQKMVRY